MLACQSKRVLNVCFYMTSSADDKYGKMAEIELSLLIASNTMLNTALALTLRKRVEKRKRRYWVRQWIGRRKELGMYNTLLEELRDSRCNEKYVGYS